MFFQMLITFLLSFLVAFKRKFQKPIQIVEPVVELPVAKEEEKIILVPFFAELKVCEHCGSVFDPKEKSACEVAF
jgi:hypothetical protein